jgi:hypothetical protein
MIRPSYLQKLPLSVGDRFLVILNNRSCVKFQLDTTLYCASCINSSEYDYTAYNPRLHSNRKQIPVTLREQI